MITSKFAAQELRLLRLLRVDSPWVGTMRGETTGSGHLADALAAFRECVHCQCGYRS